MNLYHTSIFGSHWGLTYVNVKITSLSFNPYDHVILEYDSAILFTVFML